MIVDLNWSKIRTVESELAFFFGYFLDFFLSRGNLQESKMSRGLAFFEFLQKL